MADIEKMVPWQVLLDLIEHQPLKTSKKEGLQKYSLTIMCPIPLRYHWCSLSEAVMEEALINFHQIRITPNQFNQRHEP